MKADVMIEKFKKKLSRHVSMEVELVINENRSTMLNVLSRKRDFAKISMHKMFLEAPEDVISAIAHYVRGNRRERGFKDLLLRGFIQSNLERLDYSHLLDESKLISLGNLYDLKPICEALNRKYFKGKLDLKITWYGTKGRTNRSRVTFGQYYDHLKLVKIHRILDDPFFPDYFVFFVIYHEMLHHVVPGFIDKNGLYRVHGPEFKKREKEFADYEIASQWEKKHRHLFFKTRRC